MFQETPGAVEAELEQQGFIVAFEGAKSSSNVALADRYLKWTIMEKSLCSLLNLCATNKIDSMLTTAEGSALWFQSIHILRYKNTNISINIVKSEQCCFSGNIYSVCMTRFTFYRSLERVKQGFYMKTAASWTSLLTSCPEKKALSALLWRCLDAFRMPFIWKKKCTAECKMEVLEWKANKNQDDDGCSLGTRCVAVFIVILIPVTAHRGLWIQMIR